MAGRDVSLWVYAWDLVDEGIDEALDTMQRRAGATGVNVATVYHAGKFLHVHNPKRRVVFPRSGTLYFRPDRAWYGRLRIQPPVWPVAEEQDVWPVLRRATARRGMTLTSWTLCLHNSGIGTAYPDTAVENAFGDRIPTDLCPHHPDVRAYLVAVVADIAAHLEVDRIILESLEYMPFRHGFHHEVIGVPTGPTVDFLMSLCFCPHCHAAAQAAGLDLPAIRSWVRGTLDHHFADPYGRETRLGWPELREAVDGQFGAFLGLRRTALTSLLEEVAGEVRRVSRVRLALCDFGPLYPNGPDGRAWENGVDLAQQLPLVDEVHPTFYFADPEVTRAKVAQYVNLLAGERPMVPALRAILPQTPSREHLVAQVEALAPHAAGFSFYNYGFMPLGTLDWIREAVERGAEVRT
ncbi:MAG: hypothetical protein QN122_11615 [Armatimonadota bacterium]|nr:hypothetical protein [Armatimonadota bacterium]MDR7489231.1 hypothetical protein [Armatimonadota bacterium]MDR7492082.1 hypothetical protein [Armatimonadota bacterium]MDR7528837.1 hypothetical protein [Armatimonadota bacterium]MDR7586298.1 hypothetical protein [Armatimonadota bacterium]